MPVGQGLAPCEEILAGADLPPELVADGWEVGRLVLAPEFRSNAEILKTCLLLTFVQFLEVTARANAFATCTPVLGRLYRRFGFSVLLKEACRKDGEPYSLIHGTVESVRAAILAASPEPVAPPVRAAIAPAPLLRPLAWRAEGVAA